MSWAAALAVTCGGLGTALLWLAILIDPPKRRRPNRMRRGALPPPSDKCKRDGVRAVTP